MDQLTLSERVQRLEDIVLGNPIIRGGRNEDTQAFYNRYWSGEATDKVAQHQERAGPSPKLADQTAFEEIIQRISNCNDRVCLTADKLQKIGDRIMGALPEHTDEDEDEDEGTRKSPDGTLKHTFMALNWLDASLSRLEQVALRMKRV